MNKVNNSIIENQIRRFLYKSLIFLIFFIALTLGLSIALKYHSMTNIAHSYAEGSINNLLVGEYRSAKSNLISALNKGFSKIEFIDKKNTKLFNVSGDSNYLASVIYDVKISLYENVEETAVLKFYFSPLGYVKYILIFWLFVLILIIPYVFFINKKLTNYYQEKLKQKTLIQVGDIARHVAHDIRSPLTGLKILGKSLKFANKKEEDIFKIAIKNIDNISENLLKLNRQDPQVSNPFNITRKQIAKGQDESLSEIKPSEVIQRVIDFKKLEYSEKPTVKLNSFIGEGAKDIIVNGNESDLERIVSNLLNNAFEAIDESGGIFVDLNLENNECMLEIRDSGKGIPNDILDSLGESEVSYGKANGNGMALSSAIKTIKKWKGHLKVFSKVNQGTTVRVVLPVSPQIGT